MSRLATDNFESGSTATVLPGSNAAYDTTVFAEGARSLRITGDNNNATLDFSGGATEVDHFFRIYCRTTALPTDAMLVSVRDTLGNHLASVRGGTNATTVKLIGAQGTPMVDNVAWSHDAWHYVEFRIRQVVATTDDQVELRINGTGVFNGTHNNGGAVPSRIQFGGQGFQAGTTHIMYYDAVAVNNADGGSDNTWIGSLSTTTAMAGSDTATQSETATVISISSSHADSFTLTDAAVAARTQQFSRTDTMTLAEAAVATHTNQITASDLLAFTDLASILRTEQKGVWDDFQQWPEIVSISAALSRVDSLALTDTVTGVGEQASMTASDSAVLTDLASVLETRTLTATDSAVMTELAVSLSVAAVAVDAAVMDEASSVAATLSLSDSATLTETASALQTMFQVGSDAATLSETCTLALALSRSDEAELSEQAMLGGMVLKTAFDSLVLIAEEAAVDMSVGATLLKLPTRAAIQVWAATVLLGISKTTMESNGIRTDADLDDMLTVVTLLTTE